MIHPLGPRGAIGVNRPMTAQHLANLEILVEFARRYGPTRARSSSGDVTVIACAKFGGRSRENKRRAALRASAK